MFLRKMRWLCAAIVATVAAVATPAQSKADTQILIQEFNAGGTEVASNGGVVGLSTTFDGVNFLSIQVGTTPNSGAISSLNTTVTAALAANFDASHYLVVTVTSAPGVAGFVNPFPGEPAAIKNTVGNSSGIFGGAASVSGTTQLFNQPDGTANTPPTTAATSTVPSAGSDQTTTLGSSLSLPLLYSIQQVITIRATPDPESVIDSGSTIGATAGSTVKTNAAAVPAPAGLVLALAAVPAFGLRRILRRKTA